MSRLPRNEDAQPPTGDLTRFTSAELFPLVYDELRRLAAARLARDRREAAPMQPTSLVHAAYVRLVENAAQSERAWDGRGHFFAAAALAMRRILVERARQRAQTKRGGQWSRVADPDLGALPDLTPDEDPVDLIELDGALQALEQYSTDLYRVVMLRYFAGLSLEETAAAVESSVKTVQRRWNVARVWLLDRIEKGPDHAHPPAEGPTHDRG